MFPGALDGMTRTEAWSNEYAIRRLAAINREHDEGTDRDSCGDQCESDNPISGRKSDEAHSTPKDQIRIPRI